MRLTERLLENNGTSISVDGGGSSGYGLSNRLGDLHKVRQVYFNHFHNNFDLHG